MSDNKIVLTKKQAIELVGGPREYIHTYIGGGSLIIGADWSWSDFEKALDEADEIQPAGENATRMNHPCAILKNNRWTFCERKAPPATETREK